MQEWSGGVETHWTFKYSSWCSSNLEFQCQAPWAGPQRHQRHFPLQNPSLWLSPSFLWCHLRRNIRPYIQNSHFSTSWTNNFKKKKKAFLYLLSWPPAPTFPWFCSWSQHSVLAWPTEGARRTAADGRMRKSHSRDKWRRTILADVIRILDTCTDADLLTSSAYAFPRPSEAPVTTKTRMQRWKEWTFLHHLLSTPGALWHWVKAALHHSPSRCCQAIPTILFVFVFSHPDPSRPKRTYSLFLSSDKWISETRTCWSFEFSPVSFWQCLPKETWSSLFDRCWLFIFS